MASESDVDTSRTVVQTYVPSYQRDVWDDHADELGMSRSEFVKTMVQAGRKHFGNEPATSTGDSSEFGNSGTEGDLESEIVSLLRSAEACTWDELLAGVTDDIETRLEDSLQELQENDRVRYSGRDGGYVLTEE